MVLNLLKFHMKYNANPYHNRVTDMGEYSHMLACVTNTVHLCAGELNQGLGVRNV